MLNTTTVGFVLACLLLIGGPLTGGSKNPARLGGVFWRELNFCRSFVGVIAGGRARHVYWVYLVGPIIGSTLAVIICYLLTSRDAGKAQQAATGNGESADKSAPSIASNP